MYDCPSESLSYDRNSSRKTISIMGAHLRFIHLTLGPEKFKRQAEMVRIGWHVIHPAAKLCLLDFPSVVDYVYILPGAGSVCIQS